MEPYTEAADAGAMDPDRDSVVPPELWRVVLIRAWPHDGEVAAVLFVESGPGSATPRRVATGSVDAACAALADILGELTAVPPNPAV
jgi:hypothetical protein